MRNLTDTEILIAFVVWVGAQLKNRTYGYHAAECTAGLFAMEAFGLKASDPKFMYIIGVIHARGRDVIIARHKTFGDLYRALPETFIEDTFTLGDVMFTAGKTYIYQPYMTEKYKCLFVSPNGTAFMVAPNGDERIWPLSARNHCKEVPSK